MVMSSSLQYGSKVHGSANSNQGTVKGKGVMGMGEEKELNWKGLFASLDTLDLDQSMDFFPPKQTEGEAAVALSSKVLDAGDLNWRNAVVAQFIGCWNQGLGIQNRPLILRKRELGLESLHFDLQKLPVWIHLYNVPLEAFNSTALSYIASALGMPLYIDRVTASQQRLTYAKICVKIDVTKAIPKVINVKMREG
ncbi:hypothetical protein PTKIN_Ptkin14bG0133800 [Pterospermum kingtungense]